MLALYLVNFRMSEIVADADGKVAAAESVESELRQVPVGIGGKGVLFGKGVQTSHVAACAELDPPPLHAESQPDAEI